MASSRDTSNGPDWRDVASAIQDVEQTWNQPLKVTIYRTGTGKFVGLMIEVCLLETPQEDGGVAPSACVSSPMRSGLGGGLEPALLSLIYQVDRRRLEKPYVMVPDSA